RLLFPGYPRDASRFARKEGSLGFLFFRLFRAHGRRRRGLAGRDVAGGLARRFARIFEAGFALLRAEVIGDTAENTDGAGPQRVHLFAANRVFYRLAIAHANPKKFLMRPRSACCRSACSRAASSDRSCCVPRSSVSRSCNSLPISPTSDSLPLRIA